MYSSPDFSLSLFRSLFCSHCAVAAWEEVLNPMVLSCMTWDLMTDPIWSVSTPWKRKTSLPSHVFLCVVKMTSTWGHHKWAVKPACMLSGTLAGKMYFQILATDNYVSNNNKPFLPGMLKLNHHSVSIYSRQRALELLESYSLHDCVKRQ